MKTRRSHHREYCEETLVCENFPVGRNLKQTQILRMQIYVQLATSPSLWKRSWSQCFFFFFFLSAEIKVETNCKSTLSTLLKVHLLSTRCLIKWPHTCFKAIAFIVVSNQSDHWHHHPSIIQSGCSFTGYSLFLGPFLWKSRRWWCQCESPSGAAHLAPTTKLN